MKWVQEGQGIVHNAIAVAEGRVFYVDASAAATAGERVVVALDVTSGRKLWEQKADVGDCIIHPNASGGDWCGGEIAPMCKGGKLLLCGSPFHADHELDAFRRGDLARRSLTVMDAQTGKVAWSRGANYQTRPIIVGNAIYAEPWLIDLASGKTKLDAAGKAMEIFRGSGCGGFSASAGTLFFRKGPLSYFDLERGGRIESLVGGQRPSCWVSFVAAGGLVIAPEGSAGCTCPYAIQGSVAMYPKDAPVEEFPAKVR